ncbi:MAG: hypothetical protein U1E76_22035 [Planctomycetota bacterium]
MIKRELRQQCGVVLVGVAAHVSERFYAVSVERRLKHPAVVAICTAARVELFATAHEVKR